MMTTDYFGWHFNTNLALAHGGDGESIAVGVTHRVSGPIVPCQRGLHASARAIDALWYADRDCTHVARVRLSGEIVTQGDKAAASERTYLAVIPVTPVLHEFACYCAEAALMLADVDDERCWQAIHVKREWLAGRATDADLRAAAGSAAASAVWSAAKSAADAGNAVWSAVWSAACGEMNDLLESMLFEAMELDV